MKDDDEPIAVDPRVQVVQLRAYDNNTTIYFPRYFEQDHFKPFYMIWAVVGSARKFWGFLSLDKLKRLACLRAPLDPSFYPTSSSTSSSSVAEVSLSLPYSERIVQRNHAILTNPLPIPTTQNNSTSTTSSTDIMLRCDRSMHYFAVEKQDCRLEHGLQYPPLPSLVSFRASPLSLLDYARKLYDRYKTVVIEQGKQARILFPVYLDPIDDVRVQILRRTSKWDDEQPSVRAAATHDLSTYILMRNATQCLIATVCGMYRFPDETFFELPYVFYYFFLQSSQATLRYASIGPQRTIVTFDCYSWCYVCQYELNGQLQWSPSGISTIKCCTLNPAKRCISVNRIQEWK